jgi:hypothetical protein
MPIDRIDRKEDEEITVVSREEKVEARRRADRRIEEERR